MTAFVILAAGPGTRMGRTGNSLHKALVPVGGKAVISHQIALAPEGARIIVVTGYHHRQVQDYLSLAHPGRKFQFVDVPGWHAPGGGPGASLLAAYDAAGDDDLIFTSCDTLWKADDKLWKTSQSWAGVAPVPGGTRLERWCRIVSAGHLARAIYDKIPQPGGDAYTGLAMIIRKDLPAFWDGISRGDRVVGELQVTGGLQALLGRLHTRQIDWTDTGDEAAYSKLAGGYDWAKPGEATWVLPEEGRVIKYRDGVPTSRRIWRHELIWEAVPKLVGSAEEMLAFEYVPGVSGYTALEDDPDLMQRLLHWAEAILWEPVRAGGTARVCDRFYRVKTHERIGMLSPHLKYIAAKAVTGVPWERLNAGCEPVTFHGDFNLGNVIVTPDGRFYGIDWREDFAGHVTWGDRRYDLAKLVAGMFMHWDRARAGEFAQAPADTHSLDVIHASHEVMLLAGISLLNCAPLHAPPLDAQCVDRGAWLLGEML